MMLYLTALPQKAGAPFSYGAFLLQKAATLTK